MLKVKFRIMFTSQNKFNKFLLVLQQFYWLDGMFKLTNKSKKRRENNSKIRIFCCWKPQKSERVETKQSFIASFIKVVL